MLDSRASSFKGPSKIHVILFTLRASPKVPHYLGIQVEAADITLSDTFDIYQAYTSVTINSSERFKIEGDESQFDIEGYEPEFDIEGYDEVPLTPQEFSRIPTIIPSPPAPQSSLQAAPVQDPEPRSNQQSDDRQEAPHIADEYIEEAHQVENDEGQRVPRKRKARRGTCSVIIDEETSFPIHTYHSWIRDTSDIVSRSGRTVNVSKDTNGHVSRIREVGEHMKPMPNMKKTDLMELPPVGRISESSEYGSNPTQVVIENHRDNLAISEVPETEATITPGNSSNFEGNEKSIPISSSGNDVVIL
ncbi:hypothetical protein GIB67_025707 [Kingdonia uniflora]|uniref:Uncharacterized protein n=1 Tax=Kingdonia uniflora TaxID=39325 RepID=A0A7J7KW98_9MAGN|nr:hypothetical protein GIB67_025707 [Kingdonia uniflora]